MTSLRIHLLGNPVFDLSGEPVEDFVSEKAVALLGYLVVQFGSQAREKLADLLWGDMPAARAKANLRMAIYNLQRLFPGYLQATRLKVAFNHELDYWLDVEQFERRLAKGPQLLSRPIEQFDSALSLYRGEFMRGISLSGSPELDEWLLLERERYRQLALQGFQNYAARLMASGQYSQAIKALQELLRLEPWQESAHRQLMLAQARGGNYSAALAQYEVCRQLLADELSVEPMPETVYL